MAQKGKNSVEKKPTTRMHRSEVFDAVHGTTAHAAYKRKELLATVAGSIVAAITREPSAATSTAEGLAIMAVDIANEILKQAGIPEVESSPTAVA